MELISFPHQDFIDQIDIFKPKEVSQKHIRILETSSTLLDKEYAVEFGKSLDKALARGANVQILILHPEAEEQVKRRQKQISALNPEADLELSIYRNIGNLRSFAETGSIMNSAPIMERKMFWNKPTIPVKRGEVEIKLWRDKNIAFSINMCRPLVYIARYGNGESRDARQIVLNEDSPLWSFFETTFDEYWKDENSTDLKKILYTAPNFIEDGKQRHFTQNCSFICQGKKKYIYHSSLAETVKTISNVGEDLLSPLPNLICQLEGDNLEYEVKIYVSEGENDRILTLMQTKYGIPIMSQIVELCPVTQPVVTLTDTETNTDN